MASSESVSEAFADTEAVVLGKAPPTLLLVSDLDNTMVDHTDKAHDSLLRFNALWETGYANDSILVFSTGRSPTLYNELRAEVPLLSPDITIMSVGTEIVYGTSLTPDKEWEELLSQGWDRSIVVEEAEKLNMKLQVESEQRPHKVSFTVDKGEAKGIMEKLSAALKDRGLKAKVIYSGGADMDILPEGAGKGQALAYLLRKFREKKCEPLFTLACGDSGNDIELFTIDGAHGVIVGNAMEELVEWYEAQSAPPHIFRASERCASGIIEAMHTFKIQPSVPPRDQPIEAGEGPTDVSQPGALSNFSAQREIVEFFVFLEEWLVGAIEKSDTTLLRLTTVLATEYIHVKPNGVEVPRNQWIKELRDKNGSLKGTGTRCWVDKLFVTELATGVWFARYCVCKLATGKGRETHYQTTILIAKEGVPNGLEWLHTQTTLVTA
eukprot:jgi/Mesen1/7398/ME000388S06616